MGLEGVNSTHREGWVLTFIESITNKPEWWKKVSNPGISCKWKKEVMEMPGLDYDRYGRFTEEVVNAVSRQDTP